MDGQGMAAFPAPPGGRPRVIGLGPVDSLGPVDGLGVANIASYVTSDIADRGEVQERNGDDSDVMVAPGHPEGSAQDAAPVLPQSQPSHAELPSQQIKPDKADNIVDPDRDDNAVARDENTGPNQATGSPATESPAAVPSTVAPAAAGSALPRAPWADRAAQAGRESRSSEPETVQFPAVPDDDSEAPAAESPEPAAPEPAGARARSARARGVRAADRAVRGDLRRRHGTPRAPRFRAPRFPVRGPRARSGARPRGRAPARGRPDQPQEADRRHPPGFPDRGF